MRQSLIAGDLMLEISHSASKAKLCLLLRTESVAQALPRLAEICETGYLWIDQLCIDQASLVERGHQVAIMDQIYRNGERVLIWLAGWTTETPLLMEFLSLACPIIEPLEPHFRFFGPWPYEKFEPLINSPPDTVAGSRYQAFVQLFTHPWFTRAWVFQEFVLSRYGVLVFTNMVVKKSIFRVICDIDDRIAGRKSGIICRDVSGFRALQEMYNCEFGVFHYTLANLVSHHASHAQAKDSRDLIYSLLGVIKKGRESSPNLIEPDYTIPPGTVYIQFAAAIVREHKNLDILKLLTHPFGFVSPSWVPN